jgi:hypothetical protein
MAQLADMIRQVNEREIQENESALALCFPPPSQELPPEVQARLTPFVEWCAVQKVRALPARPTTVASYIRYQQDKRLDELAIAESIIAIEILHGEFGASNPCATPVVLASTAHGPPIDPPRSWDRAAKAEFRFYPRHAQQVVAARERNRELALRRAQNDAASKRKTGSAVKATDNTEKESSQHG